MPMISRRAATCRPERGTFSLYSCHIQLLFQIYIRWIGEWLELKLLLNNCRRMLRSRLSKTTSKVQPFASF